MKDDNFNLSSETPRRGRPKTNPLSRAEQLAEAQRKRREALRSRGSNRHEVFLDADALGSLQRIQEAEGCRDLGEAVALAAAKYHATGTNLAGMPTDLVEDLGALFTGQDLGEALVTAAAKHVAEVRRKRESAKRSRSSK